jgi:ribonuclease HII
MLNQYLTDIPEAGCDEAGRGCLAGPVFAAAVILPPGYHHDLINDSKQLTETMRYRLRSEIVRDAVAWAVAACSPEEIDRINILKASVTAMHRAIAALTVRPEHLLVDGNYFIPYQKIPYHCIVHGDSTYLSIAAASILAKTYRDDFMVHLHQEYPQYGWNKNKGYPTIAHRKNILTWGITPWHRRSFHCKNDAQYSLFNEVS